MDFLISSNVMSNLYGVIIHNNTNIKWIMLNQNTTCANTYIIISEIFKIEIKCIENEKEQILPYKGRTKINAFIEDGFCLKCFS